MKQPRARLIGFALTSWTLAYLIPLPEQPKPLPFESTPLAREVELLVEQMDSVRMGLERLDLRVRQWREQE